MSVRLETLAIGDELLSGKISDTNSTFVASEFFKTGRTLSRSQVIGDNPLEMREALLSLAQCSAHVICFGGLGPTSDDRTAEVMASCLKSELIEDPESKKRLESIYSSLKRTVTEESLKQVLYPKGAEPIPNLTGLAPGFYCKLNTAHFYFLPGVPREMRQMFLEWVLPRIESAIGEKSKIFSRIWRCIGIPESDLQTKVSHIDSNLSAGSWLGFRTSFPENHLSFYSRSDDKSMIENCVSEIDELVSDYTYSRDNKTIEETVVELLKNSGKSIAAAESCTGGLLVQRLTQVPGSSKVVWGGLTTYQLNAKLKLLGIDLPDEVSAVSRLTTSEMAAGVKKVSGCDIGVGVTGYAGPDSSSSLDPVGTVYLAVESQKLFEQRYEFKNRNRYDVQWGATTLLLNLIRKSFTQS